MTIGIMGTPVSSGNRGVLALGASLTNLCAEASGGGEVKLLLVNREAHPVTFRVGGAPKPIAVVNLRMSPTGSPRQQVLMIVALSLLYKLVPIPFLRRALREFSPWIEAVATADVVGDVRGGDSFSDIYGLKRFVLAFLPVWSVLLIRGSMVQFPQTYGPFRSPLARWMGRYILRRSSVVVARDTRSQAVAQELIGPGRTVGLSPDVAFSLEAVRPDRVRTEPPLEGPAPAGVVGINVNGLMWHGGYTRDNMFGLQLDYPQYLRRLVPALLEAQPGEVWLIAHTFAADGDVESDPDAGRLLRDSLPPSLQSRVRLVSHPYDPYEIKGVIGRCDFFVGSRMHACIAALSQGVPCVGVAYSMKFGGVFASVGMGGWVIDGREVEVATAVERTLELYAQRDARREPLRQAAEEARRELRRVFASLIAGGADQEAACGSRSGARHAMALDKLA
jgi:polysaccharide pyruvyl transferase WcaK-like protein